MVKFIQWNIMQSPTTILSNNSLIRSWGNSHNGILSENKQTRCKTVYSALNIYLTSVYHPISLYIYIYHLFLTLVIITFFILVYIFQSLEWMQNNMIFYHQKNSIYIFFFVCLYGRKEKAGPSWMGRLGHLQSNGGVRLKMEDCPVFLASWCSALKPGGEAGCGEGPFRKTL